MNTVADILQNARQKNVQLSSQGGRLHYRAPKGALTPEEIEKLRAASVQIVALLERPDSTSRGLVHAPLAFAQQAHWNFYQLGQKPAVRQLASATRLSGRLQVKALEKSIEAVTRRHAALRTRIVVRDGIPVQEIHESPDIELEITDLTALSEELRETEIIRQIEDLIMQPIAVAAGPLVGIRLVRTASEEHVLIVAMEHTVSDASSIGVLLSNLFTGYVQAIQGRPISLPPPTQFMDLAIKQQRALDSWLATHGRYWERRMSSSRRLRFPADADSSMTNARGWGKISIHIGKEQKAELRQWCRLRRTTLVMSVFTAYTAAVLSWCGVSEAIIQYQTDGRVESRLANTIGFLASVLYLRMELRDADTFVDLLKRSVEEYCSAHEHADFYYLETRIPKPEFLGNPAFNWVPPGFPINVSDLDGSQDALTLAPIAFEHPMLRTLTSDNEPLMLLYESEDAIDGGILFPLNRFSSGNMERFTHHFTMLLRTLLENPERRVKDLTITEDLYRAQRVAEE